MDATTPVPPRDSLMSWDTYDATPLQRIEDDGWLQQRLHVSRPSVLDINPQYGDLRFSDTGLGPARFAALANAGCDQAHAERSES